MWALLQLRVGSLGTAAAAVAVGFPLLAWLLAWAEKWRGVTFAKTERHRSLRVDLSYLIVSPVVETLSRALSACALALCAYAIGRPVDPELLTGFGLVVQQPRWAVWVEMLVLGDLIYYWTHRLAHEVPALWRFHAVHHSTRHLRGLSALRAHPAEIYIHVIRMVPLFLLGFPVDALAPLLPFITLYSFLIHSDLPLSFRRVSYLFNSPLFHRWHHALDVARGTKNFAGLFPIFDVIFGTYHLPRVAPSALGVDDVEMPQTLGAQIAYPFRPASARLTDGVAVSPSTHADRGVAAHEPAVIR